MDKGKSRLNALFVIDKHRKRRTLLRRSYLKKVKCARQNYKPEDVLAAMHAIWKGMSRRQAAKVFNIPRSTLLDKLDGKRPVDASPGPNPFLTKAEERTLESWAINLYQRGFPLKTEDLKDMAQAVIQNNQRRTSFKNGRPGRSWMRNFLLRHPKIFEISADAGPGPRRSRTVTTREEVRQWCQQHRQFLASQGQESILDHPDRVFNVDHGEFVFDSTTGHLLEQERNDRTEEKDVDKVELTDRLSNGTESVSIVATFSAAGTKAPIMFVHPFKDFSDDKFETLPPGWIGTYAECGLLTGKVFLDYLVAFRKWLEQEAVLLPVVLLVDGRRSRLNMDVTRYCEEQGIILYCLFPTPRPAITELFSSVYHDSSDNVTKFNFGSRLNEALTALDESSSHSNGTLPHLQTMLQTLAEVRSEPLDHLPFMYHSSNIDGNYVGGDQEKACLETDSVSDIESECEFDIELTPVEGEIEMEFHCSDDCDPLSLAVHPALLAGSEAPSYIVFDAPFRNVSSRVPKPSNFKDECFEDRIDQPDVSAHLIVKPLSSPLPDTDRDFARVESEIDDVLGTIVSMGSSHQGEFKQVSPAHIPSEEPFLGFSPEDAVSHQGALDAHSCLRFMEKFLIERGLLEDFKVARCQREWLGLPEARILFDVWLAACDESNR